jgi:hypothetical protein
MKPDNFNVVGAYPMYNVTTVPTLTHRQWLAGMAMQGILVCPTTPDTWNYERYAREAYRIADDMLAYDSGKE